MLLCLSYCIYHPLEYRFPYADIMEIRWDRSRIDSFVCHQHNFVEDYALTMTASVTPYDDGVSVILAACLDDKVTNNRQKELNEITH